MRFWAKLDIFYVILKHPVSNTHVLCKQKKTDTAFCTLTTVYGKKKLQEFD